MQFVSGKTGSLIINVKGLRIKRRDAPDDLGCFCAENVGGQFMARAKGQVHTFKIRCDVYCSGRRFVSRHKYSKVPTCFG